MQTNARQFTKRTHVYIYGKVGIKGEYLYGGIKIGDFYLEVVQNSDAIVWNAIPRGHLALRMALKLAVNKSQTIIWHIAIILLS